MCSVQAFGDIHGRSNWKRYIDEKFDHIIFVGDYFDNKEIAGDKQIANFEELLAWKRRCPHKVHLLFGNHDYHYFAGVGQEYSGLEADFKEEIAAILNCNMQYLQPSFTLGKVVFCHAGITNAFANRVKLDISNIDRSLQNIFDQDPGAFGLHGGCTDGTSIAQSPIWVRPPYLLRDKLRGYRFVVGHTKQDDINFVGGCAFIDTQDRPFEADNLFDLSW